MPKVCILSSVHIALDNRVFYREARSLQQAGYDVTLIAVHDREEVRDGVHIRPVPKVPRTRRPLLWRSILEMARQERADVYHFHDPELLLVTPILRHQTGRPTIYDIHEVYSDFMKVKDYMPIWLRYPIAWNFRWFEPLLARLQSGLIFAVDELAPTFRQVRLPKTTLYNYPSLNFIERAATRTQPLQPRPPVVLYLGAMERNRGTALMVEAFALVADAIPEARLFLVGPFSPPSLESEVRAHVTQKNLSDKVIVTGRVPFETIGVYLQQAAVGWISLQPVLKNQKSIPTKLFEYMAYGLPVVSSDLVPVRPFLENDANGFRVTPDDPAAHASAIIRLLQQPEKAASLGQQGQRWVRERWNWSEMVPRLLNLYDEVLEVHR